MRRTPVMIDQKDPWRMLADAIVLQAVKDYRSRIRLMKRIRKQMRKRDISKEEKEYLELRYHKYKDLQDTEADFFFSDLFATLTDLDGYDLLDRLNKEAK